jgi:phosphatidylserine decarboxylase
MMLQRQLSNLGKQENLNFLVTNRIPRAAATMFMARFAKVRTPWVRDLSIAAMQMFTEVSLGDATKTEFDSLHDCFIRELKPGARIVNADPEFVVSPCDALVGCCGPVRGDELLQVKGAPYSLTDLMGSSAAVDSVRDGTYVTLRLTAGMYHRFHAPTDGRLEHVTYISGDTWNTNPAALKRVKKLFCKNERVVLHGRFAEGGAPFFLVAVASILVASVRIHALDLLLHLKHTGPNEIDCDATFKRGEELGWFELGSTIILLLPPGYTLAAGVGEGTQLRMGQALLRRSEAGGS